MGAVLEWSLWSVFQEIFSVISHLLFCLERLVENMRCPDSALFSHLVHLPPSGRHRCLCYASCLCQLLSSVRTSPWQGCLQVRLCVFCSQQSEHLTGGSFSRRCWTLTCLAQYTPQSHLQHCKIQKNKSSVRTCSYHCKKCTFLPSSMACLRS